MRHLITGLIGMACLTACTSIPKEMHFQANDQIAACYKAFERLENDIQHYEVQDAHTHHIEGFPYLRSNRFYWGLRPTIDTQVEFEDWTFRMHKMALQGLQTEWRNLPEEAQTQHDLNEINECGALMMTHLQGNESLKKELRYRVEPDSEYSSFKRILGLYALTALPFRWGISKWHKETHETFSQEHIPTEGMLVYYSPPPQSRNLDSETVKEILHKSRQNSLYLPEPGPYELSMLFDTFAPIWEVDILNDNDLPGKPFWEKHRNFAHIDTDIKPNIYRYPSYTLWKGWPLLQLNYVIWFKSRPKKHALDTLGGHMDGLVWRVTLGYDGKPLLYDSVHTCGCYHMFFPSDKLIPKTHTDLYDEGALVPAKAPQPSFHERVIVRISAQEHFIEDVRTGMSPEHPIFYQWEDYHYLESLPHPEGGRKSLFKPNGMVAGTERLERLFFWPMGIANAGAMRQRGTHATAFVGNRHFDDPHLIDTHFATKTRVMCHSQTAQARFKWDDCNVSETQ